MYDCVSELFVKCVCVGDVILFSLKVIVLFFALGWYYCSVYICGVVFLVF